MFFEVDKIKKFNKFFDLIAFGLSKNLKVEVYFEAQASNYRGLFAFWPHFFICRRKLKLRA